MEMLLYAFDGFDSLLPNALLQSSYGLIFVGRSSASAIFMALHLVCCTGKAALVSHGKLMTSLPSVHLSFGL